MKLSHEEVRHIAELAKLGVTDEEVERFSRQLSDVLDYVDMLNELDTDEISPTAQVIAVQNVTRTDEPCESLSPEEVLANAPDREGDRFRVHAILE